jgi:hypothetical protein
MGGFSVMGLIMATRPNEVLLTPITRKDGTKIVVAWTGPTTAIVAESRRAEGYDKGTRLTPGVVVYIVDTSLEQSAGVLKCC